MDQRPPSYISCAQLARELDMSERTVYDMVKRGVLPRPIKLSAGCVRWSWSDVQHALNSLASGSGWEHDDPFMKGVANVTTARQ